jgi:hypothetical protein
VDALAPAAHFADADESAEAETADKADTVQSKAPTPSPATIRPGAPMRLC